MRNRTGGPGRLQRLVRHGLTSHALNKLEPALLFSLLDVLENGVQIVVEADSVSVSYPTNLIDNWIIHDLDSSSSSGVQMIGALNPLALQTVSITGRITALAKCRQFHVNR